MSFVGHDTSNRSPTSGAEADRATRGRATTGLAVTALLSLVLGACFSVTNFDADRVPATRTETFSLAFTQGVEGFDVLFVVDKTSDLDPILGGVADESEPLATDMAGYGAPVEALASAGSGSLAMTLHVGVITSDLGAGPYAVPSCTEGGDLGALQAVATCPTGSDRWLSVTNGSVEGYSDTMSTLLGCLVTAQSARVGCRFRQPLEAVRQAAENAANTGFFRDNAGLAIVLVTSEDDCSTADPAIFDPADAARGSLTSFRCFEEGVSCDQDPREPGDKTGCLERAGLLYQADAIADWLRGWKRPAPVVVTAIAGPPGPVRVELVGSDPSLSPSCQASNISGKPAIRVDGFLTSFAAADARPETICAADMTSIVDWLKDRMASSLAYRCLPTAPYDTDTSRAGLQPNCTAADVDSPGTVSETRTPIPSCADSAGTLPCWEIVDEPMCTSAYRMEVRRATDPSPTSEVQATCEVPAE